MGSLVEDGDFAGHMAEIVKALAHPVRLRIVASLCGNEENVGALATGLGEKQAIVSQQLRILRMSGLVRSERRNGHVVYRLAEPRLRDLVKCLEGCTMFAGKVQ